MVTRKRRRIGAVAAGFALLLLALSSCEDPLAWQCENFGSGCRCYIVEGNTFDEGGSGGGSTGVECGRKNTAGGAGHCCFILDADGDPALCTCSLLDCKSGYESTKSCS